MNFETESIVEAYPRKYNGLLYIMFTKYHIYTKLT